MTDPLNTLLRDAADTDMSGVRLQRPDGVTAPMAPNATRHSTPRATWMLAAAVTIALAGVAVWSLTQPVDTDLRVGTDAPEGPTSPGPSVPPPSETLATALKATMVGDWNATLELDGDVDVYSYQAPDRFRLDQTSYGGSVTVWVDGRAWVRVGTESGPAGDAATETWTESPDTPNSVGILFEGLSRPDQVVEQADGSLEVTVDPVVCLGGSGASVEEFPSCRLRVRLDGAWISRVEIPNLGGGSPIVFEPVSSSAGVEIADPERPASTTSILAPGPTTPGGFEPGGGPTGP